MIRTLTIALALGAIANVPMSASGVSGSPTTGTHVELASAVAPVLARKHHKKHGKGGGNGVQCVQIASHSNIVCSVGPG
jgi:hypothetical protein